MIEAPKLVYWSSLGNLPRVEEALRTKQDVDAKDEGGYSAVHAAAENGHVETLRLLIAHGANVNPVVGDFTPLDLAIMAGKGEAAELLKQNGGTRHAG